MSTHTYPIVGGHFRPPANGILATLRGGAPLTLIPEPSNEYDPNAVKVVWYSAYLPVEDMTTMDDNVLGFGFSVQDIKDVDEWHLGYVPRGLAAVLAPELNGQTRDGVLGFDAKGKPMIIVEDPAD